MTEFKGFPRELPDFLLKLKFNNTHEKLEENKVEYKKIITEPLKALHTAVIPAIMEIGNELELRPSRCISSMYTDRRFSPKTPLKEYMYLRFKALGRLHDIPGFYFDMGLEYYSYGLRIYEQTSGGMEKKRERIAGAQKAFDSILKSVNDNGFTIRGDKYKKDHFPAIDPSLSKELMNHRNYYIGKEKPLSDIVYTSMLADELMEGFLQLRELFKALN